MAQSTPLRPQLVAPRATPPTLEATRSAAGTFDVDAFHAMDKRDETLIEQELLHGAGSSLFVYEFEIQGTKVTGISVIGARHIAATYGGLHHRLVASVQKTGELFTFTSYPAKDMPMQVSCAVIQELRDEEDFYGAIVEIADIKSGNALQVERRENRFETTRSGRRYERPHYATIAQSKAYRNAILGLIPQDVQIRWKAEMLKLGKGEVITASVLEEKRGAVLRFAARQGLIVDRRAVDDLTLDQIAGLGDAARAEELGAFVNAARSLGLEVAQGEAEPDAAGAPQQAQRQQPQRQAPPLKQPVETQQQGSPAAEPGDQSQPSLQAGAAGAGTPAEAAGEAQPEKTAIACAAPGGKCRYAGCEEAGHCLAAKAETETKSEPAPQGAKPAIADLYE